MAIAQGAFAICRFAAGGLMKYMRPHLLLLISVALTLGCVSAAMGTTGRFGLAVLILEYGTKGMVFPTTFSLSLKGLGRHTKRGSSLLIVALVGGAVWVPATGAVADAIGGQLAFCISVLGIAGSLG